MGNPSVIPPPPAGFTPIPPPPAGFSPVASGSASAIPPPPEGFTPIPPPAAGFTPVAQPDQQPGLLDRVKSGVSSLSNAMEQASPTWAETIGAGKEGANALAGILNIVNQHAGGALPPEARGHIKEAADWLSQQGQMRGFREAGGTGEHMGAMGADYLGFDALASLIGGTAAAAGAGVKGASAVAAGSDLVKTLKSVADLGNVMDKYPVLSHAAGIGLRTVKQMMPYIEAAGAGGRTAAAGGAQSYIMSGGDAAQAKEAAIISGLIHFGSGATIGPLGDYIQKLKDDAAELSGSNKPLPPPLYQTAEPQPTLPDRTPEPQPEAPAPSEPRTPAAQRFAAHEQQVAQEVTGEHLEDLNRFRTVDERGTPTNIQQLGLPSQSATQPYQFVVPGWSSTSEAGDLLHDAGARYKQTGTRVVEGKGQASLPPWEAMQSPAFDLPRYGETPGAVVRQVDAEGNTIPLEPPVEPTREAAEPPTSDVSHREPIMTPTAFKTSVRPGSEIRQATTVGGPSILTTDPQVAAGHLDQIERIVQGPNFSALPPARQADILQSRNDVLKQMQEYQNLQQQHAYSPYLHQPTFEPLNIDQALSRVNNMGDAATEMMRGPKAMYQKWTDLTQNRPGGSFQDLNNEITDLQGKTGVANRQRLAQAQQEMQQMFNGSDPDIGRTGTNIDRAIASAQFKDGYLVKRFDDAITSAYKGAARTGDFDVNKLQSNWKAVINDVGEARARNVLGPERYEATNNMINDMVAEPAADKAAAAASKAQHDAAMADWAQREATATAAEKAQHQAEMDAWDQREQLRTQINKANRRMYVQQSAAQKAAMNPKQKWYYDVARNGWHHLATAAGMEGAASIMPRGLLGLATHKVGAALILHQILTHPAMAKLAYQGAQLGTNPAVYAPIISDMIRARHNAMTPPPEPTPDVTTPEETTPPEGEQP